MYYLMMEIALFSLPKKTPKHIEPVMTDKIISQLL